MLTGTRRKIVLFIACSLDGYIAGKDGDISWLFNDQDYGYSDFLSRIDTVVMGRKTYDQVLEMGDFPYHGKDCYVFSHSVMGGDENVEFVNRPVNEFIDELRTTNGKDIWLVGGSELILDFMKVDVVDEFIISVHPIIIGEGIPLFQIGTPFTKLHLIGSRSFSSGLVQVSYIREDRY
jgi:dihydrofolate reductase